MSKIIPANILRYRKPKYPIDPLFVKRWSPRALSGDKITKKQLMTLFEAARWAPSAFNNQEWRFVYAVRGEKYWKKFFGFLGDFNKMWCKNAAVLIVVVSKKVSDSGRKPIGTHTFDAGAAWQNMALQAAAMGLVAHGMAGFDYDKAYRGCGLNKDYQVEAMVAIGKPGNKNDLSKEMQEREFPSGRNPITHFASEGKIKL